MIRLLKKWDNILILNNSMALSKLKNGDKIAVVGADPAGALFAYFVLNYAKEFELNISVDLFETTNSKQCKPVGCGTFSGFLNEALIQEMALDGILIPKQILSSNIEGYKLHTPEGSLTIEVPFSKKQIIPIYQQSGALHSEKQGESFEDFLIALVLKKGAILIKEPIEEIEANDTVNPTIVITTQERRNYDLLAIASEINEDFLTQFDPGMRMSHHVPTVSREFYLGKDIVERYFSEAIHIYTLNIDCLKFAAIIPRDDIITIILVGEKIDESLMCDFLKSPQLQESFPLNTDLINVACQCQPKNYRSTLFKPYSDHVVLIGNAAMAPIFGESISTAYKTARSAASTIMSKGMDAEAFEHYYLPTYQSILQELPLGIIAPFDKNFFKKSKLIQRLLLNILTKEQSEKAQNRFMSLLLWKALFSKVSYSALMKYLFNPFNFTSSFSALFSVRDQDLPYSNQIKEPIRMLGRLYEDGEKIVNQGDINGEHLFVILSGKVRIVHTNNNIEHELAVLEEGEFFGEMALLDDTERSASAYAIGKTDVLSIERAYYIQRLEKDPHNAIEILTRLAQRLPLQKQKREGHRELQTPPTSYGNGDYICFDVDYADYMFIIESGEVIILWKEKEAEILKDGDFFSETALFGDSLYSETVIADSSVELKLISNLHELHDEIVRTPELALAMIRRFSLRIRLSNEKQKG